MSKRFSVIVSLNPATYGIGRANELPWKLKEDMNFFKTTTTRAQNGLINAVIMGRKTWESIPSKFRPLAGRKNIIVSRDTNVREKYSIPAEVSCARSLADAMAQLEPMSSIDEVFVMGGGSLYREAVASPLCHKLFVTEVYGEFANLDTFFPMISAADYQLSSRSLRLISSSGLAYRFVQYDRIADEMILPQPPSTSTSTLYPPVPQASPQELINIEEMQYLNHVRDILDRGVLRGDRTGTGTKSIFGVQMRFSLRDRTFPLITTKRTFWRGVAEELLWFVKGSTNANELAAKDIHIWDGNGSKDFLNSRGLGHREEGDLGPVYGFQWRHFGAKYEDMHADYKGQGIDQLKDCIEKIKTSPEDRRIIMTAWNPADLHLMALPPCHMFCQFYVANNELSCHMYQRSADMGLGVPFNIASYSLLTCMMAQVCDLAPGDFVHSIGDAHVYVNHMEALQVQLQRAPKAFPKLIINPAVRDIDGFQFCDFTIEGYNPDATIKMKMAV